VNKQAFFVLQKAYKDKTAGKDESTAKLRSKKIELTEVSNPANLSYPPLMAIDSILAQLDAEIARLTQVRSLLASSGKVTSKFTERKNSKGPGKTRKKRVLSAEARKRIADAQRKRWAAQKAKSKA
jgi:hypothetical protein